MSLSQQYTSINPSCTTHLMNQFAHRFIHALNNLNNTTTTPYSNYHHTTYRRSRRVKIAAYTAMASVVGSRRAWSRALLWKIRNRSRNRSAGFLLLRNRNKIDRITTSYRLKRLRNPNPKSKNGNDHPLIRVSAQELMLRKLVPGAESMDSWCSLMDETADYIRCLSAQVQVMKTIVDRYTTTTTIPDPIQ